VSLVAESQTVLVVHPSVPAKSVAELVALAKAKPGTLNFGSTGAKRWPVHDLVMWDNRCTMHRATVSDIGNTLEA